MTKTPKFDFGKADKKHQQVAITTTEGPLLITAGPGTGKTFTLVKRIAYLIQIKGVKPEEIMVATFTEKAAKELVTSISNELIKIDCKAISKLTNGNRHTTGSKVITFLYNFTDFFPSEKSLYLSLCRGISLLYFCSTCVDGLSIVCFG